MGFIRIAYLSGSEKLYSSFSMRSFSEMKSDQSSVYLYFRSRSTAGPLSAGKIYYGTVVEFAKTDLAYQIFQEISLILSSLTDNKIVTLDFTTDTLVTLTFSSIQD